MARNRSQTGAKAAAEARKRLARTIRPAEAALGAWIEATSAERAAHAQAVASLVALVNVVGVEQAAALTQLPADQVEAAHSTEPTEGTTAHS